MGGIVTTPVINYPEVAIVGVNKMMIRPVWDGSTFIPRKMMNLSSSFESFGSASQRPAITPQGRMRCSTTVVMVENRNETRDCHAGAEHGGVRVPMLMRHKPTRSLRPQHLQNRVADTGGLVVDDLLADSRRRLVEREAAAAARVLRPVAGAQHLEKE